MEYHSKLTAALTELVGVDEDERNIIDAELEQCTILEMDTAEVYATVTEKIE